MADKKIKLNLTIDDIQSMLEIAQNAEFDDITGLYPQEHYNTWNVDGVEVEISVGDDLD